MERKRLMVPVENADMSLVEYKNEEIQAPHLTGLALRLFVKLMEMPMIGPLAVSYLKKKNKVSEMLQSTEIPEAPMFKPEFPPPDPEPGVVIIDDDEKPEIRVKSVSNCLPSNGLSSCVNRDLTSSFRYWKIRDYAHAYRAKFTTPSVVGEKIILEIENFQKNHPFAPLLISFDPKEVRKQADASTQRFKDGNPISIMDGIFMAIKDDIDCSPHSTKGATTWLHEVRLVRKDAVCVSRLRCCGVIFIGKANMHELGLGTTGNNPNYGTTRNPFAFERYAGGSSSGPAALVAAGLCSAALGTDGGGSIRIPSSLCGVVGLKTTYGRVDKKGSSCDGGTVEIIGPIASSIEDIILVYTAISGSSPADKISMRPPPLCLPDFSLHDSLDALESLKLGKYTKWFDDVYSSDISNKCENILCELSKKHGLEIMEVVVPELNEMRIAHVVSMGSEVLCSLNAELEIGKGTKLTYDSRTNLALFRSFTASDYVAAQRVRRRLMYYHMEIFKKVHVIATPTTGITAPIIPPSALECGETDVQTTGYLMRFVISANLLGLPAISIPVGYDRQGLPIGLQLIGRPWGEATLLRLASAIEELCASSKKPPPLFYDVLQLTAAQRLLLLQESSPRAPLA